VTAKTRRAVVACIGNGLVADDAVGGAIADCLTTAGLPPNVRVERLETGGMALLDRLDGEEILVVVDAVQLGAIAGTVHVLDWNAVPHAPGQAVSAHGIGVREAIDVGRMIHPERMPCTVTLVGVEGACFDRLGGDMTPSVAAAVPRAAAEVLRVVRGGVAARP
jgi:hydrogenase maturation protease